MEEVLLRARVYPCRKSFRCNAALAAEVQSLSYTAAHLIGKNDSSDTARRAFSIGCSRVSLRAEGPSYTSEGRSPSS